MAIVKKQHPHSGWLELQFAIFDVPLESGGTLKRLSRAEKWFAGHPTSLVFVIPQQIIVDEQHLGKELHRIEALGGEGLMVRKADAPYSSGRSGTILKVKSFFDMEAVVVAHIEGKGRNKGRLGSLLVELPGNIRFKIGTGFTDAQRQNPPAVGSVITFKYYGFLESGIPRFASFLRVRE
jgi:DNA ligase-1